MDDYKGIKVAKENPDEKDGVELLEELSMTLERITGSDGKTSFRSERMAQKRSAFCIARTGAGEAVGCGAIYEMDPETAELKRVYSRVKSRGIGGRIVEFLEEEAKSLGYLRICLETRKVNENAVRFYLSLGYKTIPNYGKYKGREEAVCFEKILVQSETINNRNNKKIYFNGIETDRLLLRRFQSEDLQCFVDYRTNPLVYRYQSEGWESYTLAHGKRFVEEQMLQQPGQRDTWFQIAIVLKETNQLIGDCGIHTLEDERQAEIGYSLSPVHQHKGYALEAVQAVLSYLFKELDVHRIIANTDTRNVGSVSLLERAGFRREAHFLQSYWYRGEYTDEYQYAMLRKEWQMKNL